MSIYWVIAFFFLLFIEIITVNLVSIWFAIGALISFIISLFTDSLLIQLLVFIVVSIISLLLTKPIVKHLNKSGVIPTNLDRVIGKVGIVTKKINSNNYGEVKVLGSLWTATSDKVIDTGEKVIINKIDGVKLIVSRKEEK